MAQAPAQAGGAPALYADSSPPPPPTAQSTGSSSGPGPQQQQHKRVYQACIPCRRRKVRCDLGSVDNPHDPPCVRCRRESKECYFSATRRKRKNDDDDDDADEAAREEDAYIIRNGRKRPHITDGSPAPPVPPPPTAVLDRRLYSDQPLTPGGSVGRHQPLRRPAPGEHARSDSRSSTTGGGGDATGRGRSVTGFGGGRGGDDEPNTPLENYEARSVMRTGVYGPHDALDLLYKAATDKTHEHAQAHGPSPQLGMQTPSLNMPGQGADGMMYAQHAAAHHQRRAMHEAPIDPQLVDRKTESSATEPPPAHADALRAWTRFRFVRAGWFTAHEAIAYID